MIKDIREINFPEYATLEQATVTINDMGDLSISTQVKIDGSVVPDFSYDWEVEFKGEKYIHPVRKPQGTKDNTSMSAKIDMVFYHWAIYEMKRHYFVEMASTTAGTAIADKYIASLGLNLGNFVTAFNLVLDHYFDGRIIVNLNPDWQYDAEAQLMSISYSYIWDVLQQIHEIYGVRWTLKTNADGVCEILMGYPADEVSHIFEYGFEGGLLSVQRQVQSTDIRNRLLGRGGEKNLPYRYFKDKDPNNPLFEADPDWIPELANIAFTELRGKTFRDYVKGWKAKRYGGTVMTEPTEAYLAGYNAEKFDPIEYVEDKESIAKYGVLVGALENNEDIYPSIQGAPGEVDMIVDAEQVTDDDVDASVEEDSVEENIKGMSNVKTGVKPNTEVSINLTTRNGKVYFIVPEGKVGTILTPSFSAKGSYRKSGGGGYVDVPDGQVVVYPDKCTFTVHEKSTGNEVSRLNIPPGEYYYVPVVVASHVANSEINITGTVSSIHLITKTDKEQSSWSNTFDIWVRNIWGSSRNSGETDQQYADRVWAPILGDRTGGEARVVFASGWLSFSSDWEFPIVGYAYDDSKTDSHWRLTLAKSEAELEASGKYIPYEGYNASAGDRFFFIGIDMPYQYVLWAEERLDNFKRDSLLKTAEINPTWVIKTDKVRLNEDREGAFLVDSLNAGAQIRLASKQFISGAYETLYVQSLTYTWGMETILHPDVEIVVSDKVYAVKNPVAQIQSNIESIQRQVGSLSNIQQIIRQVCDKLYLRKDGVSDVSKSPTRFLGKVTGENFRQGPIGGRDWGFYRDGQGNAILEADKIIARQSISVNEFLVNEATYVGGLQINSAASMNVTAVEETDAGYICYFDQKQGSVANKFKVDDVAFCQQFDAEDTEVKFYKSRVIAVDEGSITISKTEINGTGIPAEDDVIIHYGNYTDKDRQFVIIRDVIGGGYERMLMGLDSVTSGGVEYYYAGKAADGKARWFVGDPEQYVKYEDGKLQVRAALNILPGTTGVENIEGLPDFIHENVGDVETGESGSNLLRNSGFTGDYLSEELVDEDVLVAESQMFSSPLDYWEYTQGVSVINLEGVAVSGFGVEFSGDIDTIRQDLYYKSIIGDSYVVSFKAISKSEEPVNLTVYLSGTTETVEVGTSWERYSIKMIPSMTTNAFSIEGPPVKICDIQLEKGERASSWGNSMLDNSSDRAYWQAQKYLNGAIKNASTTFNGGLGLTNMMMFGNYDEETKSMKEVTAGVSGIYNDENDVAFWGGGSHSQAIETVMKYVEDPNYQPTDAEVASMAKAVITHGGRAILNDIILRGYVYATGGNFQGKIDIDAKNVNGRVVIDDNGLVYYGTDGKNGDYKRVALGSTCQAASGVFFAPNADAQYCVHAALLAVGDDDTSAFQADGDVRISNGSLNIVDGGASMETLTVREILGVGADVLRVSFPYGYIRGLRPYIRKVSETTITLDKYDHTIVIPKGQTAKRTINLPNADNTETGQEYRILSASAVEIDLIVPTRLMAFSLKDNQSFANGDTISFSAARRDISLMFDGSTWWISHYNYA